MNQARKVVPFTSSNSWISQQSFYRNRLKLYDNVVQCLESGYFYGSTQLKQKFQFTIQITRFQFYFSLGIADKQLTRKQIREANSNWITIINDGKIWESGTEIGNIGFSLSIGDKVRIFGDFDSCTVGFDVNGTVVFERNCSKLKELRWVPQIYLLDSGDSVKICDCFDDPAVVDAWLVESMYEWDEDLVYGVHHIIVGQNESQPYQIGIENQDKSESDEEGIGDSIF